ncbi:hypothetical protein K493DRAFT_356112 [Basidiobolus meristosporus CBS 931.73]|uniref:Hydrophobin n=1 Tax=Basidiobolus meristosporus CBS 931.73 TaxID=1314790 RepID=A0A1Y1XZ73_9FUNG|nr:hypothetical protein K493DRAFT_356112 [Basidiobolus meristosporus CBS 931.73]|eukprot:ORX91050.1 hypothetical protein K493DRAFT_356112 [Basidiobolus meristosporus CBS 931.73]
MKLSAVALLCALSMVDVIGMTIPNTLESNQVAAVSRFQKRYNDRWNGPDDLRPNRKPSPKDDREKEEDRKKDIESTVLNSDKNDSKTRNPGPDTQPLNHESSPNAKPMDAPKDDSNQVTGNRKDDASPKTVSVQPKSDIDSKNDGDAKPVPKDAKNDPLHVEDPKNISKTDAPGTHDLSKDATNNTKQSEHSTPEDSSKKDDSGNASIPKQGTPMEEVKSPKDSAKQGADQAGKDKDDRTPDNRTGNDHQSKGIDQGIEKAREVSQDRSQDHDSSKNSNPAAPKDSRFPQRPATDFPPKISSIRNDHITRSQCQDIKVHARALGIDVDAVVCIGGLVKVFVDVDIDGVLNPQWKKREACRDIDVHTLVAH